MILIMHGANIEIGLYSYHFAVVNILDMLLVQTVTIKPLKQVLFSKTIMEIVKKRQLMVNI
jgi:hypothetical protein